MVLASLATTADLSARKIKVTDAALVASVLDSASAAVRDAAGVAITRQSTTINLTGSPEKWLPIPLAPVRGVSAVSIDGETVTDYRLRDGRMWRLAGWGNWYEPSDVQVTVDHGVDVVPADIVDLVCTLVAAGVVAATEGAYDPRRGISSERVDDYQVSFTRGPDEVVGVMVLPERTRAWLRQRFGGGVYVSGGF